MAQRITEWNMMNCTIVGDVVVAGFPRHAVTSPPEPGGSALGLLRGGDLTIGNLEVPLTDGGVRSEKLVSMRAPSAGAAELAEMGFDLVSLAMNHAMDFGAEGMRDTVRALDVAGVAHAGYGESVAEAVQARTITVEGRSIAFFSFCSAIPRGADASADRPGIAAIRVRQTFEFDSGFLDETPGSTPFVHSEAYEPDVVRVERLVREADETHDHVIVALHWGVPFPYLPTSQAPLAEYQQPLARRLIDAGADLVIGGHPHCIHPVEFYGDGLILYSTGNFVFDWCDGWTPDAMQPNEDSQLSAPYLPTLMRGPWFQSAVFRVGLGGSDGPSLRVEPIELDGDSQPLIPRPEVAAAIIADLAETTRALDASTVVHDDGTVTRNVAIPAGGLGS